MIKEIKYNGFTETPSDYECPDGDLATVTGLVPEDEALHPVQPPRNLFRLPAGYTVCFVHANASGYKHYIIRHDYTTEEGTEPDVVEHNHHDFYWLNMPDSYTEYVENNFQTATRISSPGQLVTFNDVKIYEVNAIGNTLLFLTEDGMYYSLWKGATVGYKNLGNHIPETQISFGLQGRAAKDEEAFQFQLGSAITNAEQDAQDPFNLWPVNYTFITEDFINAITDNILSSVNKFIAKRSLEEGKFIYPFLVRYAYKLYDESLVMHSVPVLMIPDSQMAPHCFITDFAPDAAGFVQCILGAMLCDLDYKADSRPASLTDWGDIVKSVEIYISAPLYTYNQAGKIKSWSTKNYDERGYGIFNLPDDNAYFNFDNDTFNLNNQFYIRWYTSKLIFDGWSNLTPGGYAGLREMDLPRFDDDEMIKKIIGCQDFYFLKSIPIDKLNTGSIREKIVIKENYLASLSERDRMNDDTGTHDVLVPQFSFTYNSRLHIANIAKRLTNPFYTSSVVAKNDRYFEDYTTAHNPSNAVYTFYIFIRENDKEIVIKTPIGGEATMSWLYPFLFFYYPNPNAYRVVIDRNVSGSHTYYQLELTPHDFLNGAVYFGGFGTIPPTTQDAPQVTTDNLIELPNKIYTSEVNNPFVFPPAGMRTIGISKIVGIRPAVKAMSPSQYGQFKFYVFTMEGVWALEVSTEGYLQEPTLVTPDVVLGGEEDDVRSITQIDSAVLFASDRGIMMLSGSTCTCLSDDLNSRDPFIPFATLPANDVLPGLRTVCGDFLTTIAPVPFRTFIEKCSMLYDYPHQRIILYSASHPYAYVFSLKSKQWGMIPSAIQSTVLDYPNAMAMIKVVETTEENNAPVQHEYPMFADYSHDPEPAVPGTPLPAVQGLIITRPLKLDMADVLKTVESIIQRGDFRKGHVQSILYASRDLENWLLVKSSVDHYLRGFRGTPYKYFRIVLLCQLDDDESVFGCSIQFNPRYQNQLR